MPVKHGPRGMRGEVAGPRESFGTPYSVGEARAWVEQYGDRIDVYPRELMLWLCDRIVELEAGPPPGGRPPGVPGR